MARDGLFLQSERMPTRTLCALVLSGCLASPPSSSASAEPPPAAHASPAPVAPVAAPAFAWTAGGCAGTSFDFGAVNVTGRAELGADGGLRFGWSGTLLSARFSGRSLSVDL